MLRTNTRYVLLCALRDKLFIGMLTGIIAGSIISSIIGSTAFLEDKEMSLSFAGAASRFILVTGLIVFVCFHIRSSFDTREIDVMLSRPTSRAQLVIDHWVGFCITATLLVLPTIGILALIGVLNLQGFLIWSLSMILETWLVVALAMFAALVLRSAVTSVLASMGIYVLARMMVYFLLTADAPGSQERFFLLSQSLKFVSLFLPRLDLFGKSEWLVYGVQNTHDWTLFILQAAIYIPLLLAASIIDFRRRQF